MKKNDSTADGGHPSGANKDKNEPPQKLQFICKIIISDREVLTEISLATVDLMVNMGVINTILDFTSYDFSKQENV
jgi:hypothetical protein